MNFAKLPSLCHELTFARYAPNAFREVCCKSTSHCCIFWGPSSDWTENRVNDTLVEADLTFADISFSAVSAALTRYTCGDGYIGEIQMASTNAVLPNA
jgi:hypothetical protein